ncbi:ATP-binding cassette domain-containing protein [Luteimicrobium subarcticum]|uniref:ATP-binding cassette subfamily B protein n=1 Tax=Luteimicrobium subarcticum TaxID=620910 RepID=A0A2M8W1L3_9MICO|nr:ABC transporter ATP-binding protein [Luteimicrobium subarcticum]PJI84805.1 ATP-binding cassette subfamily B protein [Luteimicrobium subarcticum]
MTGRTDEQAADATGTPGRRPGRVARAGASFRAGVGRWAAIVRLLPQAGAPLVAGGLVLAVVLGLLPLLLIVLLGRVLFLLPDVAAGGASDELVRTFVAAVVVLVAQQALAPFQTGVVEVVARRVDEHCVDRLLTATLRDAPLATLDDAAALDLLADARAAFARHNLSPGDAVAAILPLVSRYVQLLGAAVLVGVVVSPVTGALILATAVVVRYGNRRGLRRFGEMWGSFAASRRSTGYLRDLATTGVVTKEVRLLGLLDWLRERLRAETLEHLRPLWTGRRRILFWPFVGYAVVALAGGGAVLVLVAVDAGSGGLDLFALGVALQALLIPMRFGVYFPDADVQTQYGMLSHDALVSFEESALRAGGEAGGARAGAAAGGAAGGDAGAGGCPETFGVVRFEDVSFRYSDDGPWVLRHLDLELVAGRSTAIVGLNGAGKSTLVKLLARLYAPTEGRITVDGVDVTAYASADWHRRLALIFQDYVRLELPAADNVGWGAPHLHDDPEALAAAVDAAVRAAGADVVVDRLPDGMRTTLASGYPGGQDLSGGQWQRVALARALLAVGAGARVLVLDEPTAQLDVRAEAEFFDRFLAPGAVGDGVTSVVISHRFSTVRPADRIVVLEHGRVVEQGDHDELVALGGRYAELFELQASRFRVAPDAGPAPVSDAALTSGGSR